MAQLTFRPGDPCWVDLYTADTEASIAFYTELFGWTVERGGPEYGGYLTFRQNGLAVGGGMGRQDDDGDTDPDRWTVFLTTPDIQAVADATSARGGQVFIPPMLVPENGYMAILSDPGGAAVGAWQAEGFAGFETVGVVNDGGWSQHHGIPSWFELTTRSYATALDYYRDVFGWQDPLEVSNSPDLRYTCIHSTSPMLGGVMDATGHLPAEAPSHWGVYFGADDVDKTAERITALGGRISFDPMDTPYGRLAGGIDPTGARFSIGGNIPS